MFEERKSTRPPRSQCSHFIILTAPPFVCSGTDDHQARQRAPRLLSSGSPVRYACSAQPHAPPPTHRTRCAPRRSCSCPRSSSSRCWAAARAEWRMTARCCRRCKGCGRWVLRPGCGARSAHIRGQSGCCATLRRSGLAQQVGCCGCGRPCEAVWASLAQCSSPARVQLGPRD